MARLPYPIFTQNGFDELRSFLAPRLGQLAIVADENTARLSLPLLSEKTGLDLPVPVVVAAGEAAKSLPTCELLWNHFLERKLDRSALVLLVGGGAVGDVGGFAAATWKRGIDFAQVPTTLLSMVDSSIGGKQGIDFLGLKNQIGVFQNPAAVFICPEFLATLPARELRSGFAEMVKHALISSRKDWDSIKNSPASLELDWPRLIPASLTVKKKVVEKDPFERGLRKVLNFGHTIGHAVESLFLEKEKLLLHGEAVAVGMICESWLSFKTGGLSVGELAEITAFLLRIFGTTDWPVAENPRLLELMRHDKKNSGAAIRFALLEGIGRPRWDVSVDEEVILESLRFYAES